MDKDKLLELRKKKLEAKNKQHKQTLEAQEQVRKEIKNLAESISGTAFDWDKFKNHINELGEVLNLHNDVKVLSTALEKVHKDALNSKDLDVIVNAVNAQNNNDIIEAINSLKKSLQKNAPDQKPEDFIPTRRVIKVGSVLQFDDKPTSSGGVGGGGGVQPALTRNGNSIAVVNPDGTPISAGGGGGGDATAAKQDEQTALLQQIEDNTANIEINADSINLNTDEIEAKLDEQTTELIQANAYLAGTVNQESTQQLIQSDLGTVIGSINPGGFASANKQDEEIALLTEIESNQLPDNHQVSVSNLPPDYPLPAAQVTALTPQTDALTDAELRASPIDVDTGIVQPTTPTDTQPVSAASLPLPTGAATSSKQDTAQASLNTVTTDLDYRYSGGKSSYVTTLAASGDTTLITPASGKRIQVYWIAFVPNSDNTAANLISLGFGTAAGSIDSGQEIYRGYALAHWELFTGATNKSVIINAGTAQPVAVTIHYKEIT